MSKTLHSLSEVSLSGKRVLLRAGFDVPIEDGKVIDTTRIDAVLPTMKHILEDGAALIIMAHQGRPKGERVPSMSQQPLVPVLSEMLGVDVQFAESCRGEETKKMADALKPGEVLLLENLRYEPEEKKNDAAFGKELASYADIYVNDAFPNFHRTHASVVAVAEHLPAYMGLQVEKEIEHLTEVRDGEKHPLTLIISGAKMETKVPIIEQFLAKGDDILLGGCIANTCLAARGFDVGESKYEEEFVEKAQSIMLESEKEELAMVHVPRDVVVASDLSEDAEKVDLPAEDISGDMKIFDIGKVSIDRYIDVIKQSSMIVWNGPLGLYEYNRFSHATKRIAEAVAEATKNGAISIIGGGDTLDFHERYHYPLDVYTFVSTGGGAMLEYISGKSLPALKALKW